MKTLYENLDGIKKFIRTDRDFIIVIDGREGCGKSSLALWIAEYIETEDHASTFGISRVTFTEREVYKTLHDLKKYQAMIIDEGENVLFSRESMRKPNREMIKTIMSITRAKNIVIIINIPDFLMIDKYIKLKRVGCWIHIVRRGIFKFYNGKSAKTYAKFADKMRSQRKVRMPDPDFFDTFEKRHDELWLQYNNKKTRKGEEDIRKKLIMAERAEHELVSLYEASLLLGFSEDRVLDMINNESLKAGKDEYDQWKIEIGEVNRKKDELKRYREVITEHERAREENQAKRKIY
jgi:ABC-type dipeptide/oligopeptide/nickel transport system ATPase component